MVQDIADLRLILTVNLYGLGAKSKILKFRVQECY